jgi:hypothetical protein
VVQQGQQDDDWNGDTEQPQQNSASHEASPKRDRFVDNVLAPLEFQRCATP